jgi:hypothetical protein
MSLFTQRGRPDPEQVERVKGWARAAWNLPEDVTVMVTELECREPGCPPLETVVAVLRGPGETSQVKIHKPVGQVVEDDLRRGSEAAPDHAHEEDHP